MVQRMRGGGDGGDAGGDEGGGGGRRGALVGTCGGAAGDGDVGGDGDIGGGGEAGEATSFGQLQPAQSQPPPHDAMICAHVWPCVAQWSQVCPLHVLAQLCSRRVVDPEVALSLSGCISDVLGWRVG